MSDAAREDGEAEIVEGVEALTLGAGGPGTAATERVAASVSVTRESHDSALLTAIGEGDLRRTEHLVSFGGAAVTASSLAFAAASGADASMVCLLEEYFGPPEAQGAAPSPEQEADGSQTAHESVAFLWHSQGGAPLQRSESGEEWTELDAAGSDGFTPGPDERSAGVLHIRADEVSIPAPPGVLTPSYDSRTPDLRGLVPAQWPGGGGGASPPAHPPTALREAIALHDAHAVEHLLGMLDYTPTAEEEEFARTLAAACSCRVCERLVALLVAHREPKSSLA